MNKYMIFASYGVRKQHEFNDLYQSTQFDVGYIEEDQIPEFISILSEEYELVESVCHYGHNHHIKTIICHKLRVQNPVTYELNMLIGKSITIDFCKIVSWKTVLGIKDNSDDT